MNNLKRLLVVFIVFFIHGTLCEEVTMFDAIIQNCTFFKSYNQSELNDLQKQLHFSKCKDWNAISSIGSFSQLQEEKLNRIRCLLFFEIFISFCNDLPSTASTNYRMIFAKSIPENITDVKDVCKSLSLNSKIEGQNKFIWKFIKNEKVCEYICSEVKGEVLGLNGMCATSYYYNNLTLGIHATHVKLALSNERKKMITTKQPSSKLANIKKNTDSPSTQIQINNPSINPSQIQISSDGNFEDKLPGEIISLSEYNAEPHLVGGTDIIPEMKNTNLKGSDIVESAKTSGDVLNEPVGQSNQNLYKGDNGESNEKQKKEDVTQAQVVEEKSQQEVTISSEDTKSTKTSSNFLNEHVEQPNQNLKGDITPSNEQKYNGISIRKQEEKKVTLPQAVEEKYQQGDTVSDTFPVPETNKDGQFSETYNYDGDMEGNSYFFTYFTLICVSFIVGYVGYHNKQKVLALLLEGRKSRRTQRDIRPNSANYHKLDSTLEEAISSSCNKNTSYVIY